VSKFKVGDKVKIREDLIWDYYYGDIRCSSKRLECRGKIGEITKIAKTGSYFVHNHWFSEEMLEACDSKNTLKFKIRDKVRIVGKNSECLDGFDIDDICEIVEIDEDDECNPYHILKLCAEKSLYGWAGEDDIESLPTFEYIDDTMNTSNRPVVDLSDHAVDSLYPNIIMDVKTCGKNLFDNCEVQTDFYEKYIKGIWKNEEEKDMNKVVNLWYERKRDKVINEYKEKEVEFYNNRYSVVESFNALVEQFNEDLESLYKMDKATEQFVLTENAPNNVIKYCLDLDKLKEEFEVEYLIKRNEELKEIEDIREEVEAQLSLSDDLKYQQEVLERYGIINKKTKKIAG
jgi:hypothetical protein